MAPPCKNRRPGGEDRKRVAGCLLLPPASTTPLHVFPRITSTEPSMVSPRVNWSELPSAVLDLISRLITTNVDYVRFRAVCNFWRSSTAARPRHLPCQLPWLALPLSEASDVCRFFSLPDGKIDSIAMPGARGSHRCGSSFGWLAFLDTSVRFFLLNPLTREQIWLPPLNNVICEVSEKVAPETDGGYVVRGRPGMEFSCDFEYIRRYFVNRFVLSSDPTSADCVAMASLCHGTTFAFCTLRGDHWATLTSPVSSFQDIVLYKGRFYTVDTDLVLYVCDVGPPATIQEFPYSGEDLPDYTRPCAMERCLVQGRRRRAENIERVYLVESRGDLLMVLRTYDDIFAPLYDGDDGHLMLDFEVYKLDPSGEPPRWVELESLGDRVLFLGPGCSLSLSAGDFPGACRSNCIYFSDYWPMRHMAVVHGGPDFGIFHFGDGHVERVPCCPFEPGSIWQPSIWITPSLRSTSWWE